MRHEAIEQVQAGDSQTWRMELPGCLQLLGFHTDEAYHCMRQSPEAKHMTLEFWQCQGRQMLGTVDWPPCKKTDINVYAKFRACASLVKSNC